jgi:hypothetical protein
MTPLSLSLYSDSIADPKFHILLELILTSGAVTEDRGTLDLPQQQGWRPYRPTTGARLCVCVCVCCVNVVCVCCVCVCVVGFMCLHTYVYVCVTLLASLTAPSAFLSLFLSPPNPHPYHYLYATALTMSRSSFMLPAVKLSVCLFLSSPVSLPIP